MPVIMSVLTSPRLRSASLLLGLLTIVGAAAGQAADGASLEETIAWLKSKYAYPGKLQAERVLMSEVMLPAYNLNTPGFEPGPPSVLTDLDTRKISEEWLGVEACKLRIRQKIVHQSVSTKKNEEGTKTEPATVFQRTTTVHTIDLGDLDAASVKVIPRAEDKFEKAWAAAGGGSLEIAFQGYEDAKFRSETQKDFFFIHIDSYVGKAAISSRSIGAKVTVSKGMELSMYPTTDRELAQRVVKALQHAVLLCGGQVEPF